MRYRPGPRFTFTGSRPWALVLAPSHCGDANREVAPDGDPVTLEASIGAANYVWKGATGRFTIKAGTGSLAVGFVPTPKPTVAKPGHGHVHITALGTAPVNEVTGA